MTQLFPETPTIQPHKPPFIRCISNIPSQDYILFPYIYFSSNTAPLLGIPFGRPALLARVLVLVLVLVQIPSHHRLVL